MNVRSSPSAAQLHIAEQSTELSHLRVIEAAEPRQDFVDHGVLEDLHVATCRLAQLQTSYAFVTGIHASIHQAEVGQSVDELGDRTWCQAERRGECSRRHWVLVMSQEEQCVELGATQSDVTEGVRSGGADASTQDHQAEQDISGGVESAIWGVRH